MQRKRLELLGRQFGLLTVIAPAESGPQGRTRWRVRCKCGKEWVVPGTCLTRRRHGIQSCPSCSHTIHGMRTHPAYQTWVGMRRRCGNPTHVSWKYYGERGIVVCKRWRKSFQNFWEDMGPTYKPGLTIDRIANNKGYSKKNCWWATRKEQVDNRRNSLPINLSELSRQTGIPRSTLSSRYYRGSPLLKGVTL